MGRARRARRSARRARRHRPQGRRRVSDRPSAARRRAGRSCCGRRCAQAIAAADVILSLDWVDLAGTLKTACGGEPAAKIIQVSLDHVLHNGWSMDHQGHPPVDVLHRRRRPTRRSRRCSPRSAPRAAAGDAPPRPHAFAPAPIADGRIDDRRSRRRAARAVGDAPRVARASAAVVERRELAVPASARLPRLRRRRRHRRRTRHRRRRGARAAAARGVLPVAVCGDGDFLMGATALWTAVHYRIPAAVVVANNRSFYNDEVHQERVARMRGRPVENKWIGQRIADPDIDLAAIGARAGRARLGTDRATATISRPALAAAVARRRARATSPSSTCACSRATRRR